MPKEKWFKAEAQEWFIERVRDLKVEKEAPKQLLMGRHLIDLGLTPSPIFKEILEAVYEKQLDGQILTVEEAIQEAAKILGENL